MSYTPKDFLVWAELPVSDLDAAIAFYSAVTGAELTREESGPNPMAIFRPENPKTGVALNLYPGTPAGDGRGPSLHIASQGTLEETRERVRKAGGEVVSDPIQIPEGRFFYAKDPDGNSISLFEVA